LGANLHHTINQGCEEPGWVGAGAIEAAELLEKVAPRPRPKTQDAVEPDRTPNIMSSEEELDEEEEFVVRKVKDMCRADGHRDAGQKPRPHGGHWVYWVRWKGFPSSDNTWEPAECFSDSKLWRRFNDKLERLMAEKQANEGMALAALRNCEWMYDDAAERVDLHQKTKAKAKAKPKPKPAPAAAAAPKPKAKPAAPAPAPAPAPAAAPAAARAVPQAAAPSPAPTSAEPQGGDDAGGAEPQGGDDASGDDAEAHAAWLRMLDGLQREQTPWPQPEVEKVLEMAMKPSHGQKVRHSLRPSPPSRALR